MFLLKLGFSCFIYYIIKCDECVRSENYRETNDIKYFYRPFEQIVKIEMQSMPLLSKINRQNMSIKTRKFKCAKLCIEYNLIKYQFL